MKNHNFVENFQVVLVGCGVIPGSVVYPEKVGNLDDLGSTGLN